MNNVALYSYRYQKANIFDDDKSVETPLDTDTYDLFILLDSFPFEGPSPEPCNDKDDHEGCSSFTGNMKLKDSNIYSSMRTRLFSHKHSVRRKCLKSLQFETTYHTNYLPAGPNYLLSNRKLSCRSFALNYILYFHITFLLIISFAEELMNSTS